MKLWLFFLCIRLSSQDDQMQPWTITFINCPRNLLQNVGKVVWCLYYFVHHHPLQNMKKKWFDAGLLASLACLLDNLCHASASIAKKWKKKCLMRTCLPHNLWRKVWEVQLMLKPISSLIVGTQHLRFDRRDILNRLKNVPIENRRRFQYDISFFHVHIVSYDRLKGGLVISFPFFGTKPFRSIAVANFDNSLKAQKWTK